MRAAQTIRRRDVHSTFLQHIVSNGAARDQRYQSDQAQSLCRALQPDSFGRSGTKSLNYRGLSSLCLGLITADLNIGFYVVCINGVSQRSFITWNQAMKTGFWTV
jgi:hypothetical protein